MVMCLSNCFLLLLGKLLHGQFLEIHFSLRASFVNYLSFFFPCKINDGKMCSLTFL